MKYSHEISPKLIKNEIVNVEKSLHMNYLYLYVCNLHTSVCTYMVTYLLRGFQRALRLTGLLTDYTVNFSTIGYFLT